MSLISPASRCRWYRYCAAAFALTAAASTLSLPSDRQQPINIESDRALRNDRTGVTVYEGAVNIVQGTINIRADQVTVYMAQNKVSKIVCKGEPAHYQQQIEADSDLVTAQANTIEYYLDTDMISLIDAAHLHQEGSTLKGDRIDYDITGEMVEARGDISGKQRIQMVIPPNQQKASEE